MRLIIFLTTFLLLYGGLHLYAFLKVIRGLSPGAVFNKGLAAFMIIMVLTPVLVRVLERLGFELFSKILAHVGYTWMGILFLFVFAAFVLDLYRLFVHLCGLAFRIDLAGITLSARFAFFTTFVVCLLLGIYAHFEALRIRTEHITISSPKIPEKLNRFRIVQISDVHLGLLVGEGRLKRILEQVRAANPDILVSTGDLVDAQTDHMSDLAGMFRAIKTKYGKFAVTGNHEFYAGLDHSLGFASKAGFTMLRGEGLCVGGVVNIAGVDDPTGYRSGPPEGNSENALLSSLPKENFTILLKHRPLVDDKAQGLFDIQLSGHTHSGQIFPFTLIVRLFYPQDGGLLPLQNGSLMYVSRGSGTWGPPMRFLAPPEVTVIDLVHI